MAQDKHQQALERFKDASDSVSENYSRMKEDLRFSNPADPQQWDEKAKELRKGRPCLTFDRTNQFIAQVVNAARQNKPSIHVLPADSKADIAVAEKLNGIVRHIEYVSRAGIAYDTAIENAARVGLGWLRVVPEVMRPDTNEQEIRIKRVHDMTAAYLEAGWSEPDGSDATHAFIETLMTKRAFKAAFPKAKDQSWEGGEMGAEWFGEQVRICEYFDTKEKDTNRITFQAGEGGEEATLTEDEYWALAKQIGFQPPIVSTFMAKSKSVKWYKLSGAEVLEETDFPSQFLPLVPVIGHEVWIEGKRYLCGMTRRLMDSQRAYNYERSAFIESVAMQPKAPFLAAIEAMEGFEGHWSNLNSGNPAVLPYNGLDPDGKEIPRPERQHPPDFPAAFAQGGQIATQDMEASVGMFRANLGQPGTAVSGRAKREDKAQGDTANFHYTDNLSRSIEQLGRLVVDMIPRLYDTKRQARIVGEDGSHDFVQIDPEMDQAVKREPTRGQDGQMREGKKVVAINPAVGAYDVRVKTGPAYTTLREESAEQLANMMQAAPNLMPILGDLWIGMQDWPDAEKAARRLQAMLPPQIQQMESDEGEDIPPEAQAQIMQMQQQIQQMQQALQEATQAANETQAKVHIAEMQREVNMEKIKADVHIADLAHGTKAQADIAKEQMKGQHGAMSEQAKASTALQVAQINAENRIDVASIAALTQLELAAMAPDPELQSEIAEGD
jgi:hypothetical protein